MTDAVLSDETGLHNARVASTMCVKSKSEATKMEMQEAALALISKSSVSLKYLIGL